MQLVALYSALYAPLALKASIASPGVAGSDAGKVQTGLPADQALAKPKTSVPSLAFSGSSLSAASASSSAAVAVVHVPAAEPALYDRFAKVSASSAAPGNGSGNAVSIPDSSTAEGLPSVANSRAEDFAKPFSVGSTVSDGQVGIASKEVAVSRSESADEEAENGSGQPSADADNSYDSLNDQELQEVRKLAAIDREVRAHEQAHIAVGGQHAGAVQYSYEKGPDGINYAVAGEVSIDVSVVAGKPEATIAKMQQVRRAALAPADPSPQDRSVAAQASQTILQAQAELARERSQDLSAQGEDDESALATASSNQASKAGNETQSMSDKDSFSRRVLQTYTNLALMADAANSGADTTYVLDERV